MEPTGEGREYIEEPRGVRRGNVEEPIGGGRESIEEPRGGRRGNV